MSLAGGAGAGPGLAQGGPMSDVGEGAVHGGPMYHG